VLGMDLSQGGHLTHGYKLNFSGKYYNAVSYGVDPKTHLLDYDKIRDIALKEKPKLIVCGATAYPRKINFKKFADIAKEVNAYLLADISHITGLVIAGVHETPIPHADVVMTTAHKTLRGPRGAIILVPKLEDKYRNLYRPKSKRDLGGLIDAAIIPGLQGGPHNHQTASIAVALEEASKPDFKEYGKQTVSNAKALAESLVDEGMTLISGGTDNHLILMDVSPQNISGKDAETLLDSVSITLNKNMIPFDPKTPLNPSGIRMGTPALTSRGMKEPEMKKIGLLISSMLKNPTNTSVHTDVKKTIHTLTEQFPLYPDLRYV
jgi:glycine hydroxymethyltransferase